MSVPEGDGHPGATGAPGPHTSPGVSLMLAVFLAVPEPDVEGTSDAPSGRLGKRRPPVVPKPNSPFCDSFSYLDATSRSPSFTFLRGGNPTPDNHLLGYRVGFTVWPGFLTMWECPLQEFLGGPERPLAVFPPCSKAPWFTLLILLDVGSAAVFCADSFGLPRVGGANSSTL